MELIAVCIVVVGIMVSGALVYNAVTLKDDGSEYPDTGYIVDYLNHGNRVDFLVIGGSWVTLDGSWAEAHVYGHIIKCGQDAVNLDNVTHIKLK